MLVKAKTFNSIFDDLFDSTSLFGSDNGGNLMKTDVIDNGNEYNLFIDLAGFTKDEVSVDLEDGYLTITANKTENNETEGKYLRRERTTKSLKRTFFVEDVEQDKITAKMSDGVLTLTLPKVQEKQPAKKSILID